MTVELKVLERIKKMLALGNDSAATEGERENALRMAYNLLAKHNLSMNDLPGDANNEPREKGEVTISADKWARSLANSIAELFFCKYFYQTTNTSGKDRHFFVGRVSNTITTIGMVEYLTKSIKREATKRYGSPTSPLGRSFCVGTVSTIRNRVSAMLMSDTEDAPGTALMVISLRKREVEANGEWMEGTGTVLVTGKTRADNSLRSSAYHAGKDFGKNVSLNAQIGAQRSNVKLLA